MILCGSFPGTHKTDITKCFPNEADSTNPLAPCQTCLKVRRDSMKTIHHIPCIRSKVTSMAVYRPGGLNLTRQFDHNTVVDIASDADGAIYGIEMEQGLCRQPFRFRVRRFRPKETDIVHRRYMDGGRPIRQNAGAFCLADVEETAKDFKEYINSNALAGLTEAAKDSDPIVRDVFGMIVKHCDSLPVSPPSTRRRVVAEPSS